MSEALTAAPVVIDAAMPLASGEKHPDAIWIGTVDDAALASGVVLAGATGYRTARLLVRAGRTPRGFVELPLLDGALDSDALRRAVDALPPAGPRPAALRPPISVVLCTYDRPVALGNALRSLLDLDYPSFEVVVVDNHPASGSAQSVVDGFSDPRLRLVHEPARGLARARNTGALAARHPVIAFTDDDVVIDRFWLHGIADGFAADGRVGCVSGIVPAGEIATSAQMYFDRRVSWSRNCLTERFSVAAPPPGDPMFPFQVARFGTGANFALRRDVLLAVGGFDERLGVGSASGGGEDIDMFVRVLLAGYELVYEPSALVWHKHREDPATLSTQIKNYGTGLGAWLTKLALNPRTLVMVIRRIGPGVRHLRQVTRLAVANGEPTPEHYMLWRTELRAVAGGPLALARARAAGGRGRPLAGPARRTPIGSPKEEMS